MVYSLQPTVKHLFQNHWQKMLLEGLSCMIKMDGLLIYRMLMKTWEWRMDLSKKDKSHAIKNFKPLLTQILDMKDKNQLHFGEKNSKMEHSTCPKHQEASLLLKTMISWKTSSTTNITRTELNWRKWFFKWFYLIFFFDKFWQKNNLFTFYLFNWLIFTKFP